MATPDPLQAHLLSVLALYEHGPLPASPPTYGGPQNEHTDVILRQIDNIARRMQAAEATQRSVSDIPANSQSAALIAVPSSDGGAAAKELQLLKAQLQDVARVCNAVARGDFSQRVSVPVQDIVMVQLKDVVNTMVETIGSTAQAVGEIIQQVGMEGRLGGVALVFGIEGAWRELVDVLNKVCTGYTNQIRDISRVTKAVAAGDLSTQISVEARGEVLQLKDSFNELVVQLRTLTSEAARVTSDGSHGLLGAQMNVPNTQGVWYQLTRDVNKLSAMWTDQIRAIAAVITAIAHGDLTREIEIPMEGELDNLKTTINTMSAQLSTLANEAIRLSLRIGTDGRFGKMIDIPDIQGTWEDLRDNLNIMSANLTLQVRGLGVDITALANGDTISSGLVGVHALGEMLDLKQTVEGMVGNLEVLTNELLRISTEYGAEGRLGGRIDVPNVRGAWKSVVDHVNTAGADLTNQIRAISAATSAIAAGNLPEKITGISASGEVLDSVKNINKIIDQLGSLVANANKSARKVGIKGKPGAQAETGESQGIWKELAASVKNFEAET